MSSGVKVSIEPGYQCFSQWDLVSFIYNVLSISFKGCHFFSHPQWGHPSQSEDWPDHRVEPVSRGLETFHTEASRWECNSRQQDDAVLHKLTLSAPALCFKVLIIEQSGCISKAFLLPVYPLLLSTHACLWQYNMGMSPISLTWSLFQSPDPWSLTMVQRFSSLLFSFLSFFYCISEKILLTFWIKFICQEGWSHHNSSGTST